jgi:hypothetical protein
LWEHVEALAWAEDRRWEEAAGRLLGLPALIMGGARFTGARYGLDVSVAALGLGLQVARKLAADRAQSAAAMDEVLNVLRRLEKTYPSLSGSLHRERVAVGQAMRLAGTVSTVLAVWTLLTVWTFWTLLSRL